MDTILCPTDFSASSENAVLYADEVATRMNMRLVLFHNISAPVARELVGPEASQPAAGWQNPALEQERKAKLEALKKVLEMKAGEPEAPYTTLMRYGQLQESIPEVARQQKASLMVLGNEGVEGLKDIFVGSVAAGLIPQSPCPVLIVPPNAVFKPLNKIVFAADLGQEPLADVDWVLRFASLFDAEILFVHVLARNCTASTRPCLTRKPPFTWKKTPTWKKDSASSAAGTKPTCSCWASTPKASGSTCLPMITPRKWPTTPTCPCW